MITSLALLPIITSFPIVAGMDLFILYVILNSSDDSFKVSIIFSNCGINNVLFLYRPKICLKAIATFSCSLFVKAKFSSLLKS